MTEKFCNFHTVEFTKSNAIFSAEFKCYFCDLVFHDKCALKLHENSHRECEYCGKTFVGEYSKRNFEKHMNVHIKPPKSKTVFECTKCEKAFKCKRDLQNHKNTLKCRTKHL